LTNSSCYHSVDNFFLLRTLRFDDFLVRTARSNPLRFFSLLDCRPILLR
jgi:hypothetical protein